MNILYVHGYASGVKSSDPKYTALSNLGTVLAIAPDYDNGSSHVLSEVLEFSIKNDIDLIVGTSMGGWVAPHISNTLGIPFVALNPSIHPSINLKKYGGDTEIIDSYPDISKSGFGLVSVEMGDEVIDPKYTIDYFSDVYNVIPFDGGSHRFSNLDNLIDKIKSMYKRIELVSGFDAN
jgi:predicted esterase YcpF (UPF0227 family)